MPADALILLCDIRFDGGLEPCRISTAPWRTPQGDPAGFRMYPGSMMGDPEFVQRVSCAVWSENAATSISTVEVNNADGRFDSWLDLRAADSRVEFRLAREGDAWGDTIPVLRAVLLRVEQSSRTRLRLVFDTLAAILRRPLMTERITTTEGNEQTSPVMIGRCFQVQPALTNASYLVYRAADAGINGWNDIYSGGAPFSGPQWDYDEQRLGFEALISPAERVTATGFGSFGFASNVLTNSDLEDWTGGSLDWWTTHITGTASATEVPGVGVRLQWAAGSTSRLISPADTLPDTDAGWYLIKGRVARRGVGVLYCLFRNEPGTLVTIEPEGDFCVRTYVPAGADRTFWIGSDATEAGDVVLDYVELRKLSANQSQFLATAIREVVAGRGALRYSQVDTASADALSSAASKQVGYYQPPGGSETAERILTGLLAGWTGWAWVDELGQLRFGRLVAPDQSATPAITLTTLDIVGGVTVRTDTAANLSDTYAGRPNWSPYTEQELAGLPLEDPSPFTARFRHVRKGEGILAETYAAARGAKPVETWVSGGDTQVSSEATRVVGIFSETRRWFEVSASLQSSFAALSLQPGAIVRLVYPRFGLESGRNLLLIGKRCRPRSGLVQLTLWG